MFRLCYGDIKLFKVVCFDPKLHFFENDRKNTEIKIKSSLTLDGKVHILPSFDTKISSLAPLVNELWHIYEI